MNHPYPNWPAQEARALINNKKKNVKKKKKEENLAVQNQMKKVENEGKRKEKREAR